MKYYLVVADNEGALWTFDLEHTESIELHEEPEQQTTVKKSKAVKVLDPHEFVELFKAI